MTLPTNFVTHLQLRELHISILKDIEQAALQAGHYELVDELKKRRKNLERTEV